MQSPEATIFHAKEWGEFLKKILHGKVETIESEKGLLPIFRGCSIPLADYCGPIGEVAIPDDVEVSSLKKLPGFKESPFCTFKLAVGGKSYEEILKTVMHQKTRNMINKAVREGVTVSKSNNLSDYYRLYVGTMLRLNRMPLPMKAFQVLSELFKDKFELYLAKHNGRFVGGIVSFVYNKRMHVWSNASDKNFASPGVNNALYGFAIRRACELKLREVDFGSSLVNSSHHFFKKRFGGVELSIYCNHEIKPNIKPGLFLRIITFKMKFLPVCLVSFISKIAHKII